MASLPCSGGEVGSQDPAPHFLRGIHHCVSVLVQLLASRSGPDASSARRKRPRGVADIAAGMPPGLPESAAFIQIYSASSTTRSASCTALRSFSLSQPKLPSLTVSLSTWLGSMMAWREKRREWYQRSQKAPHSQTPKLTHRELRLTQTRQDRA